MKQFRLSAPIEQYFNTLAGLASSDRPAPAPPPVPTNPEDLAFWNTIIVPLAAAINQAAAAAAYTGPRMGILQ